MSLASTILWDDLLARLQRHSGELYRAWFRDLALEEMEHGVLVVTARNANQLRYLESQCRSAFNDAAQNITGRIVTVAFELGSLPSAQSEGNCRPDSRIPARHTFEEFVEGPENRLALASCVALANGQFEFNPLVLVGPEQSGKTHLLHAISNAQQSRTESFDCRCDVAASFVNEVIAALERHEVDILKDAVESPDIWLLDDLHDLAHKPRTQDELFRILNARQSAGRPTVVASRQDPNKIDGLAERISSRLQSGLVVHLDRPCLETRIGIARRKAERLGIDLTQDGLMAVAEAAGDKVGGIDSVLSRIAAAPSAPNLPVDSAAVASALQLAMGRSPTADRVLNLVAERFGVSPAIICGRVRSDGLSYPRALCAYLLRNLTPLTLAEVGETLGGRDATTILSAVRGIEERIESDNRLSHMLKELSAAAIDGHKDCDGDV